MTLVGQNPRNVVHDLVAGVAPLDAHEAQDKAATLHWVRSGAPLFRIARPATTDKHLCVYFTLFDEARRMVVPSAVRSTAAYGVEFRQLYRGGFDVSAGQVAGVFQASVTTASLT